MRGKEIITKLIIPGAIAMIICLIVHPMCMNGEILDWRKLLLFVGNKIDNSWCNSYDYLLNCSPYVHEW